MAKLLKSQVDGGAKASDTVGMGKAVSCHNESAQLSRYAKGCFGIIPKQHISSFNMTIT